MPLFLDMPLYGPDFKGALLELLIGLVFGLIALNAEPALRKLGWVRAGDMKLQKI